VRAVDTGKKRPVTEIIVNKTRDIGPKNQETFRDRIVLSEAKDFGVDEILQKYLNRRFRNPARSTTNEHKTTNFWIDQNAPELMTSPEVP